MASAGAQGMKPPIASSVSPTKPSGIASGSMSVTSGQSLGSQKLAVSTGSSVIDARKRGSRIAASTDTLPPSEWPVAPALSTSAIFERVASPATQSSVAATSCALATWLATKPAGKSTLTAT